MDYRPIKEIFLKKAKELEKELLKDARFVEWQNNLSAAYCDIMQAKEKEKEKRK